MLICPKCGAQMQEGSNMCIRCGNITYDNGKSIDGSKNNGIDPSINMQINPNTSNPTFISNNLYGNIHDNELTKFQKILNIYISFFLAFWCIVAIVKSIRLNMSIVDVLIYGIIIAMHIIVKKSIERKTKPAGFISIFLSVFMIILTSGIPIFNIISIVLGIIWIFCAIRYLMIIEKRRNKMMIILSIIGTILIPIILVALIGYFVNMFTFNKVKEKAAEEASLSVIDAVKLKYLEQKYRKTEDIQYEGDVTALNIPGIEINSGHWSIDKNNGEVTIKDVVFGEYVCSGTKNDITCNKK